MLGPEHPDTLQSMNNLAATLYALGDVASARDLLQQVVSAYQQLLGPEHPAVRTVAGNLAWVQRALDEPTP